MPRSLYLLQSYRLLELVILQLHYILAEKKPVNFKKFMAQGHQSNRPWLRAATLNLNIKSNEFVLQNSQQNQYTEPSRLFLFLVYMRF